MRVMLSVLSHPAKHHLLSLAYTAPVPTPSLPLSSTHFDLHAPHTQLSIHLIDQLHLPSTQRAYIRNYYITK